MLYKTKMEKTFIAVRDVDKEIFMKFRAMSVSERMKLGDALSRAMRRLMEEKEAERNQIEVSNLLKVKPTRVGKKVNWSKEVDDILYGLKE